ncbi:hypothetical protein UlMin_023564 [Ulmus minor]
MRSKTRSSIKVSPQEPSNPTHSCAMEYDNFIQFSFCILSVLLYEHISGESDSVRRALFAISAIMYKFTAKEEIHLDTNFCPHLDVLLQYPLSGLYPGAESIVPSRCIPPIINTGTTWPLCSSALPIVSGFGGTSRTEELVLRVLCPFDKIGRVIGKVGNTIKGIRQASGARIEVDDTRGDRDECIITITATEGKINDEDEDMFTMRLLIPSKGIGCIIGKSGSIISEIRKRTRADVHISKGEKPESALIVVGLSMSLVLPSVPPVAPLGYAQRADSGSGLGMISSSGLYGYGSLLVFLSFYSSKFVQKKKKQTWPVFYPLVLCCQLETTFLTILLCSLPTPSILDMMIPANAMGKVMGKGAANLTNGRKICRAMVKISESKSSWGDHIAHISGTPEQKHTVESLIKDFMMAS